MKWVIITLLAGWGLSLKAADINAASASLANVQSAVNSAVAGDRVLVPAGSATWSSSLTINKNIQVIGAGTNSTIITCSGQAVGIGGTTLGVARFSGFKLMGPGGTARGLIIASAPTNHVRIDHCWIQNFYYCVEAFGVGVVDHCTMVNWGLAVCNTEAPSPGGNPSDAQMQFARNNWFPIDFASTNALYFEDNQFVHTSYNNANNLLFTANWCGGYVVRNNTGNFNFVGSFQQMFDWHGNQGNISGSGVMRGSYAIGAYRNTFVCTGATMSGQFAHIRSGSGLFFSNVLSGTVSSAVINLQEEDADGTWGYTGPPYFDIITNVWIWNNTPSSITGSSLNSQTEAARGTGVFFSNTAPAVIVTLTYPHPLITAQDNPNDPTISVQPQNRTAAHSQTATFSVTALGNTTLSYQWNWYGTNVTGATSASWTTPSLVVGNSGSSVFVTVTDTAGSVQSSTVTLTVTSDVAITTQPQNQSVNVGDTATFTVVATGGSTLHYQWRFNGGNVGTDSSAYSRLNCQLADSGGQVRVTVSDILGQLDSSTATLAVSAGGAPPASAPPGYIGGGGISGGSFR